MENKVNLKLDKENINDELNIILSEIYRKHINKTIEQNSLKFTTSFNIFKKNIEKDNDYYTNLIIIKCLVDRMSDYFTEFRDNILCNKIYKTLKVKFKELMELTSNNTANDKDEVQKHVYWIKFQNKISGLFDDISLIYKAVIKSSGDIDNLFRHCLLVISKERCVCL